MTENRANFNPGPYGSLVIWLWLNVYRIHCHHSFIFQRLMKVLVLLIFNLTLWHRCLCWNKTKWNLNPPSMRVVVWQGSWRISTCSWMRWLGSRLLSRRNSRRLSLHWARYGITNHTISAHLKHLIRYGIGITDHTISHTRWQMCATLQICYMTNSGCRTHCCWRDEKSTTKIYMSLF